MNKRDELEAAILARLTAKSDHMYQWPRWAAAYEAAEAAAPLVVEMLAAAWDEGYDEGADDTFGTREANPYRTTHQLDATEQRENR